MSRRRYPAHACMVRELFCFRFIIAKFSNKDFILDILPLMWVAQSVCLDLDAISSGELEVSTGGPPGVSPVVMSDQELTVISVHSSDTHPDSSEEGCLSDSLSEPVSPIPADVPGQVVESPSHYPALAEPVELSAVSSVLISPNRDREDCSSVSLDVYPVYEVSPDTTGCVPSTAPGGPTSSAVS